MELCYRALVCRLSYLESSSGYVIMKTMHLRNVKNKEIYLTRAKDCLNLEKANRKLRKPNVK